MERRNFLAAGAAMSTLAFAAQPATAKHHGKRGSKWTAVSKVIFSISRHRQQS